MRIVGGKYKGRIFRPNKSFKARPTTDIAKEALFNVLENRYDFTNKNVLDLFSGTGSIGYEFISRGCRQVTMVEMDFMHHRFIGSVLDALKIDNARAIKADVFKYIKKTSENFDIVFADPPFDLKNLKEIPELVLLSGVVKPGGLFILEHPREYDFSGFENFRELRKYGKVHFSFFEI